MPEQTTFSFIREFGFPVLVAVWFMWRLEKRLDRLIGLQSKLLKAISLLAKSIDYMNAGTGRSTELQERIDEDGNK